MRQLIVIGAVLGAIGSSPAVVKTASPDTTISGIHLPRAVVVDGQALPAGTYQVRITDELATPAAGQSADGERWVEFLKGGRVVGRELATVVSASDIGGIAKGPRPEANHSRLELLKGGDYFRVWINRGGTNYIINVPVSDSEGLRP